MKKSSLLAAFSALLLLGAGCVPTFTLPTATNTPSPTDGIVTSVVPPDSITAGEDFSFDVWVENTTEDVKYVRSIDIENALTEGASINFTGPDWSDQYPITDWEIYDFDFPVEAGGTEIFTFYGHADRSFSNSGFIDICINDDGSCIRETVSLSTAE